MCSELPREPSFSQHLASALCGLERGKKLRGERAEQNVFFQALKSVLVLQGMEPGVHSCLRVDGLLNQTERGSVRLSPLPTHQENQVGRKKPGFIPRPEQLLPGQHSESSFWGFSPVWTLSHRCESFSMVWECLSHLFLDLKFFGCD